MLIRLVTTPLRTNMPLQYHHFINANEKYVMTEHDYIYIAKQDCHVTCTGII